MGLMVPILTTMYIRIFRVKKVFEAYEEYMKVCVRTGSMLSVDLQSTIVMDNLNTDVINRTSKKTGIVINETTPKNNSGTTGFGAFASGSKIMRKSERSDFDPDFKSTDKFTTEKS